MPNVNCSVVGCKNNTKRIKKWKDEFCKTHNATNRDCSCERPFNLYCFPSILKNGDQRRRWIKALRRVNANKSIWEPKDSDRVCSIHFVDDTPTLTNPDPTLHLGYVTNLGKKPRRELKRSSSFLSEDEQPEIDSKCEAHSSNEKDDQLVYSNSVVLTEHSYIKTSSTKSCDACTDKSSLIDSLVTHINYLNLQVKAHLSNKNFTWRCIKTDKKMNFYTGITSIALFNAVFMLLKPYVATISYWKGPARYKRTVSKVRRASRTYKRKLTQKDEFLMTLMRLRLGLLNEDLADRFNVSPTLCSLIFTTWIRVISIILGKALIVWLPIESIRDNLPKMFIKAGYSKCRVILDCFEVYIERAKSLINQACTWSDHKSHNTIKCLIGISPTGFITFLSDCYGGRASDKHITNDSGFYELLERGDEVMADRGFQIQEELMYKFCKLIVPPGARTKSQMTTSECQKTKHIANLRIHVERAINRLKTFRILKSTLSLTMLPHVDDIVHSCASLCNLKPVLVKSKILQDT